MTVEAIRKKCEYGEIAEFEPLKDRFKFWSQLYLEKRGESARYAGERIGIEQALHPSYFKDLESSPVLARNVVSYFREVAPAAFEAWCEDSLFEENRIILGILEAARAKTEEVQASLSSVME